VWVQRQINLWTEQESRGKRINFTNTTVTVSIFLPINQFSGRLAWNQSSKFKYADSAAEGCLPRNHTLDTRACSKQFLSNQHVSFDFFLTFKIVLNATGEASNHWQPIMSCHMQPGAWAPKNIVPWTMVIYIFREMHQNHGPREEIVKSCHLTWMSGNRKERQKLSSHADSYNQTIQTPLPFTSQV
jgi:hypothetical protein